MDVVFNAPKVLTVTLPERLTAVDDCARRTAILWLSAPFCGVKVNTPAAKLLPSADNSKPTGALTVTLPSNPAPTTGKLCGCEGVPKRVEKAGKVVAATEPLADNVGATAPFNLTMRSRVLALETTRSPVRGPLWAEEARRTAMVVETTALLLRKRVRLVAKTLVPARANS